MVQIKLLEEWLFSPSALGVIDDSFGIGVCFTRVAFGFIRPWASSSKGCGSV
jgi:hypothetical protein